MFEMEEAEVIYSYMSKTGIKIWHNQALKISMFLPLSRIIDTQILSSRNVISLVF
jgi:hypothetical protein